MISTNKSSSLLGIENIDIKKMSRELKEKDQKEFEELKSRSKPLQELIVSEKFIINEILGESYSTSTSVRGEWRAGPMDVQYVNGGYASKLILKVTPNNLDVPVRTLNFNGPWLPIRPGFHISAKIPKYEEKRFGYSFFKIESYEREQVFYLDRDFNEEESVIELGIISEDGKILERYRSVDYSRFLEKR